MIRPLSFFTGIVERKANGAFRIVLACFTPDGGKHFHQTTYVVGLN